MLKRSSGSSGPSSLINTINQSTGGMSENQLEAIGHGSGYR